MEQEKCENIIVNIFNSKKFKKPLIKQIKGSWKYNHGHLSLCRAANDKGKTI